MCDEESHALQVGIISILASTDRMPPSMTDTTASAPVTALPSGHQTRSRLIHGRAHKMFFIELPGTKYAPVIDGGFKSPQDLRRIWNFCGDDRQDGLYQFPRRSPSTKRKGDGVEISSLEKVEGLDRRKKRLVSQQ
nr:hypothetical protein CFP56_07489 [Quercus suber]